MHNSLCHSRVFQGSEEILFEFYSIKEFQRSFYEAKYLHDFFIKNRLSRCLLICSWFFNKVSTVIALKVFRVKIRDMYFFNHFLMFDGTDNNIKTKCPMRCFYRIATLPLMAFCHFGHLTSPTWVTPSESRWYLSWMQGFPDGDFLSQPDRVVSQNPYQLLNLRNSAFSSNKPFDKEHASVHWFE